MVVQINYRYWSFFKGLLFTFQCALVLQLFAVERFILYHLYFVLSTVFLIFLLIFEEVKESVLYLMEKDGPRSCKKILLVREPIGIRATIPFC